MLDETRRNSSLESPRSSHFLPRPPRLSPAECNFSTSQRIILAFRPSAVYLRFFCACRISYDSPFRGVNTSFHPPTSHPANFCSRVARDLHASLVNVFELRERYQRFSKQLLRCRLIRWSIATRDASSPTPSNGSRDLRGRCFSSFTELKGTDKNMGHWKQRVRD